MLQNGVSHRCVCVKISTKGGVSHHSAGGGQPPLKSIARYGVSQPIVSQYRAIWGHLAVGLPGKVRGKKIQNWKRNPLFSFDSYLRATVSCFAGRQTAERGGEAQEKLDGNQTVKQGSATSAASCVPLRKPAVSCGVLQQSHLPHAFMSKNEENQQKSAKQQLPPVTLYLCVGVFSERRVHGSESQTSRRVVELLHSLPGLAWTTLKEVSPWILKKWLSVRSTTQQLLYTSPWQLFHIHV